jgi:Fe2+ or Zn2+ uptake regulation protein
MEQKRQTMQRQAILDAVRELDTHATAEEAYAHVAKKHPSISKATVYRNMSQMAESGELANIGSFYGSARYDHRLHGHCHFVCEECKRVFDVNETFPALAGRIPGLEGFEITGHRLTFSGLCRDCGAKINNKGSNENARP